MRVQEHIYQGFFGLKKKQDAGEYYSQRVDKLRGFDHDLDEVIDAFQLIMKHHKEKLQKYDAFVHKPSPATFRAVRTEIEKLEGMFDEDELANNKERKYIIKNIAKLKELSNNEESLEMKQIEAESLGDLNEMLRLLEAIEPVWQDQINLVEHHTDAQLIKSEEALERLRSIFYHEAKILSTEERLLKNLDLKTGTMLRKTALKNDDIQKTKDMDMKYREIRYIR